MTKNDFMGLAASGHKKYGRLLRGLVSALEVRVDYLRWAVDRVMGKVEYVWNKLRTTMVGEDGLLVSPMWVDRQEDCWVELAKLMQEWGGLHGEARKRGF